jgi:hypothetical protein
MRVNIDQLTERELLDLNRRIVERLRMIHQMNAHVRMLEFSIGERVWFQTDQHSSVEGTLVRYNKKSVTIVSDDGGRWTVSPGLLRKSEAGDPRGKVGGKIIDADELKNSFRGSR